jgi:DNA-directed RNA polymerase specialized sigma24 family protein
LRGDDAGVLEAARVGARIATRGLPPIVREEAFGAAVLAIVEKTPPSFKHAVSVAVFAARTEARRFGQWDRIAGRPKYPAASDPLLELERLEECEAVLELVDVFDAFERSLEGVELADRAWAILQAAVEDRTHREVGELLGITTEAARVAYHRAVTILRRHT